MVSPGQISPFSQTIIGAFGSGVTITSTDANGLTQSNSLQIALYVSETVGVTVICGPVCFGEVCHSTTPPQPLAVSVVDSPAQILLGEADNNGKSTTITFTSTAFDCSLLQSSFLQ